MHVDHKTMLTMLGLNIRTARETAKLSMGTLAKLSGVSKGNLSKIENGANPTMLSFYRICWSLGVHPKELLPPFRKQGR